MRHLTWAVAVAALSVAPCPAADDADDEVQALIVKLEGNSVSQSREAAERLGELGKAAAAAGPALARRVSDGRFVRVNIKAYQFLNDDRKAALAALRKVAPEKVPAALGAAMRMYPDKKFFLALSLSNGIETSFLVRIWAANELGTNEDKSVAVPILFRRASDDSWMPNALLAPAIDKSKTTALEWLVKLDPAKGLEAVEIAARSEHPHVQNWGTRNTAPVKAKQPE
jgi:hypothetical protein